MISDRYIFCSGNEIDVKVNTPYLKLLFAIFGGEIETTKAVVEGIENVVTIVFSALTKREKDVLISRFGLDGEGAKTLEQVGNAFDVNRDRIRQIEGKALRKLRYPSQSNILRGKKNYPDFTEGYAVPYSEKLKELVFLEIKSIVEGSRGKNLYLKAMLDRNGMFVERQLNETNEDSISLGLAVEELLLDLEQDEEYNTIILHKDEEKIIYKYFDNDSERVSKSLFKALFEEENSGKNIFDSLFSPGLKELLMLKGYMYENDIYEDANVLKSQLTDFGFGNYANEIEEFEMSRQKDYTQSVKVRLYAAKAPIINFLIDKGCKTLDELLVMAKACQRQDIIEFVKEAKGVE